MFVLQEKSSQLEMMTKSATQLAATSTTSVDRESPDDQEKEERRRAAQRVLGKQG